MVSRAYAERGRGQVVALLIFLWGLIAGSAFAADDAPAKRRPYDDTGRFYFYFETGHRALFDDNLVGDVHFDEPNGWDLVLGGGGGYNISEHWGVELQAHGFETDMRSDSLQKLEEYSNIAIVPAVRFRWPLGEYRRVVPFLTAGIGYSMNDDNDQHNPRIKVTADDPSFVGSLAAGLEYFLNPDVAVGFSLRSLIFPDQDISITVRDPANRIVQQSDSSFNQTSVSFLVHMRVFFGEQAEDGDKSTQSFFYSDRGPFDTADRRFYLYLLGGHTQMFDTDFGGDVELKAPGDFNATLGAGVGMNFDRHWSAEVQFFNVAPNVNLRPYGKFTEIDNNTFLLLGRFRWPFLDGRLVPYATAGIGAGTFDLNDSRTTVDVPNQQGGASTGRPPALSVDATAFAGQVGVGLEYFLSRHLSVGLALPVHLYPDLNTRIEKKGGSVGGRVNFSGIAPQLQIKAYLN
jgi:opacity protein-like surface antigen